MKYKFVKYEESLKSEWNNVKENSQSTFLSTLEWANFKKELGIKIDQYLVQDIQTEKYIALLYLEISRFKVAEYAYLPHGPVFSEDLNEIDKLNLFTEISKFGRNYCKENNLNLFKIDPLIDSTSISLLKDSGWEKSLSPGQAKDSWIIRLKDEQNDSKNIDDLLADQKKDTRYYIRRAEKKGVQVRKIESVEEVEIFYSLMKETTERNEFRNHGIEYFKKQWEILNVNLENPICEIFVAEYEGKPTSTALINYSNNAAHYAHGASTSDKELSKLASPYFLQWKIIEDAIEKNLDYYDFWGVIPKEIKHNWRGLSDFKMKFNGELIRRAGTWEVYSNFFKYALNRAYDIYAYRDERYG